MSKFDVSKVMVEAALGKALKDLKSDPESTMQKWLERKGSHTKEGAQQVLLMHIKTMLQDPTSAYHALIKHMVSSVEFDVLKSFALNFGYQGLTEGSKTIRKQELIYDVHIPWTVSFDLDGSVTMNHVDLLIEQAKKFGIYIYQVHCRTEKAVYDLPKLFGKHNDCAFVVYVRPEAVSDRFIEQYGRYCNFLLALACHEHNADEEFAALKKAGFFYAANYEYDASNVQALFAGRYIEYAAQMGAVFAFALPKARVPLSLRKQVYDYMIFKRMEQREPVLAIEVISDSLALDRILSEEAAFLCFDDSGQRLNLETGYAVEAENLTKQSFLQILEAL